MLSFLYVYSDHSILECYNLFSGVELSMRSFFVISVQVSYLWFSGGCLTPPQSRCSTFLQRTLPNAQGCFVAGSLLCKGATV